jgi:hypothetical protein
MLKLKDLNVQYVTDQAGAKRADILSIEDFQELLENLEDLAVIAERREEVTISHAELLAELRRGGVV